MSLDFFSRHQPTNGISGRVVELKGLWLRDGVDPLLDLGCVPLADIVVLRGILIFLCCFPCKTVNQGILLEYGY